MPPAAEWSEDVLQAMHGELASLARRITRLEEGARPSAPQLQPRPPAYDPRNPLGPLFDALDSLNSELTGFADRLARLEDAGLQGRRRPRFPLLVSSPRASAVTVRAARNRRARKAVSRA